MGAGKGYFDDYPKRVGFILSNEFCERFSFYGMKAILVIFLTRALNFSDDDGTAIYHGFNMACYFMPLFGALIADGFLGHYKTIFIISIVYAIGNVVMATGAVPFNDGEYIRAIPFVGLILIAIGTGGIKPCVAAFGANQFEPHQIRQKQTFFSMFYMAINCGSLLSMIITPIIRSNVECFGGECYALAFGVPAALMLVAVALFLLGTHWYTITPPGENIIGKLFGCIWMGLKGKCSKYEAKREHWLDYADSKYDKRFVSDVKSVMRVLFMFIPLPVFYALFDQQGSRWILQAGRLDGHLGGSFVLEPDLLQAINPILVVMMVPLFESLLFPCLDKLKIPNRPLQRLGFGMTLAGCAFIISAFLQMGIEDSQPAVPASGQAHFKLINAAPCSISGSILDSTGTPIQNFTLDMYNPKDNKVHVPDIYTKPAGNYTFEVHFSKCKGTIDSSDMFSQTFSMDSKGSYNMVAFWDKDKNTNQGQLTQAQQPIVKRTHKGQASLQVFNTWNEFDTINVTVDDININATYLRTSGKEAVSTKKLDIKANTTTAVLDGQNGAVYTAVLHYTATDVDKESSRVISFYQDVSPNSLTILLMLPQYFVMTMGEVFFSVTGLSFAYSQSPVTMKAVLQAAWLLNNSLGNCLVMIITAIGSLPSQTDEFFMFAGLMFATVIIFAIMSMTYVYVDQSAIADPDKKDDDNSSGYDNFGAVDADELPPKYDVVMTNGESPIDSTYM